MDMGGHDLERRIKEFSHYAILNAFVSDYQEVEVYHPSVYPLSKSN